MKKINIKEISRFKESQESPGFLLWQVSTNWRRRIEAMLQLHNLTHTQFVLLAAVGWLTKEKERISQVELASFCSLDISMTSQVLRTLQKKELIVKKRIANDERAKFPFLTLKGAKLVQKTLPKVEKIDYEFFSELNAAEQKRCLFFLKKLNA